MINKETLDMSPAVAGIAHTEDGLEAFGTFPAVICPSGHRASVLVLGPREACALSMLLLKELGRLPEQYEAIVNAINPEFMLNEQGRREFYDTLAKGIAVAMMENGIGSKGGGVVEVIVHDQHNKRFPMDPSAPERLN